jgi:SAM-dependent methyltransferase
MKIKSKTLPRERYYEVYLSNSGAYPISEVHKRAARLFLEAKCSRVLDVGCGNGRLVEILNEAGLECIGCDYLDYSVLYPNSSPAWFQHRCLVADARSLPFQDKAFDGVALLGVLNYLSINDVSLSIKECNRVLRSNGLLLIRTNGPLNRLGNILRGLYYHKCVADSNYYPRSLYLKALQTGGFQPTNIFYSLDTPLRFTLRTLAKYLLYPFLSSLWIVARKL